MLEQRAGCLVQFWGAGRDTGQVLRYAPPPQTRVTNRSGRPSSTFAGGLFFFLFFMPKWATHSNREACGPCSTHPPHTKPDQEGSPELDGPSPESKMGGTLADECNLQLSDSELQELLCY